MISSLWVKVFLASIAMYIYSPFGFQFCKIIDKDTDNHFTNTIRGYIIIRNTSYGRIDALAQTGEVSIPFVMKYLIDEMNTSNIEKIIIYSVILLVMSIFSLIFGALAGKFCARGSTGFARNLRRNIYKNITDFSFSNIDKFSTPSLVTRITTDVTNVQMSYMQIIRTGVRAPFMMIF